MEKLTTCTSDTRRHDYEQSGLLFAKTEEKKSMFNPILQCKNCKTTTIDFLTFVENR